MNLPERMAAGIYASTANAQRVPWKDVDEHVKTFQRKLMVAALRSMLEPSEDQIIAGSGWIANRWMVEQMWRAMIEAELPE